MQRKSSLSFIISALLLMLAINSEVFAMTNKWISPVDRARMGSNNDVLSRLDAHDQQIQQQQSKNVAAQALADLSPDAWDTNISYPWVVQGRLTLSSGVPIPPGGVQGTTLYFTPYKGNLVAIYNGTNWPALPFAELSLKLTDTQSGTTVNGSAVITGLTNTSQFVVGMVVSGAGIPNTAVIASVDSATQITMNVNATASATVSVTFKLLENSDYDVYIINTGGGVLALRLVPWTARLTGAITGITNASPMVVTSVGHPLIATQIVQIKNVAGATGANGVWRVGAVTANTFTLLNFNGTNSAAGGVYTGAGNWQWVDEGDNGTVPTVAYAFQDGIYVKSTDPTWRFLGAFHVYTTAGQAEDDAVHRHLWNYYNRSQRFMEVADLTATWLDVANNVWQADHNDITNRIDYFIPILEDIVIAYKGVTVSMPINASASSGLALDGVGVPFYFNSTLAGAGSTVQTTLFNGGSFTGNPGFHVIQGMEVTNNAAGIRWTGNGQHHIWGTIWS